MAKNRRIAIFLGHPAHFHLFKNAASKLMSDGYTVDFLIKRKDVLEDLLKNAGFTYYVVRKKERTKTSRIVLIMSVFGLVWHNMLHYIIKRPKIVIGTYGSLVERLLGIPLVTCNEDDAEVVPRFAETAYPFSNVILAPSVCNCGKWEKKAIKYQSYHELAYLHPDNFTPDKDVAAAYISLDKPYVLMRFAKLSAHHDSNIKGISTDLAIKIIDMLKDRFNVYITSERPLDERLEAFRLKIKPIDIHHVMAFASFYIGDSQTMAAESGVLGVPFVRFNDFVGRIGYLKDLEDHYHLGFGVKTDEVGRLLETVTYLSNLPDRGKIFSDRRAKMLTEKIELSKFLVWFIENYPRSKKVLQEDSDYQFNFR